MAHRERVFERALQGPLTEQKKNKLSEVVQRRLGAALTKQEWHPQKPVLTITTPYATLIISFAEGRLTVEAEYSRTARLFLSEAHRQQARTLASAIADEAEL